MRSTVRSLVLAFVVASATHQLPDPRERGYPEGQGQDSCPKCGEPVKGSGALLICGKGHSLSRGQDGTVRLAPKSRP